MKPNIRQAKATRPEEGSFLTEAWIRHAMDALKREEEIERKMRAVPAHSDEWWRLVKKLDKVRTERLREKLFEAERIVEEFGRKAERMAKLRREADAI